MSVVTSARLIYDPGETDAEDRSSSSRGEVGPLQKPLAVLLHNECADPVSFDMVAIVKQRLVSAVALFSSSGDENKIATKRRKIG